jgi:hypothetical protein
MSLNSAAQPMRSDRWLPDAGIRIHAVAARIVRFVA